MLIIITMLITNWAELTRLNFLPRLFDGRRNNADEHREHPGKRQQGMALGGDNDFMVRLLYKQDRT